MGIQEIHVHGDGKEKLEIEDSLSDRAEGMKVLFAPVRAIDISISGYSISKISTMNNCFQIIIILKFMSCGGGHIINYFKKELNIL